MSKKSNIFITFLAIMFLLVVSLVAFIQSHTFARILVSTIKKYAPIDLGVDGTFSELNVKLIPPGVVLESPSITLNKGNPLGLPENTQVTAKSIDVTFQLFQLLTGSININAAAINGAVLKLDLDDKFIDKQAQKLGQKNVSKTIPTHFDWNQLIKFNFRSLSLIDSQIDVSLQETENSKKGSKIRVQSFAKELTIGKSTVDKLPGYDLVVDLQRAYFEYEGKGQSFAQIQGSVEISKKGLSIRNLGVQENDLNFHTHGSFSGDIFNPKTLKSDLNFILKGPLEQWVKADVLGQFEPKLIKSGLQGEMAIEGKLKADMSSFLNTAQANADVHFGNVVYQDWKIAGIDSKVEWHNKLLNIDSLFVKIDQGSIEAKNLKYDFGANDQSFNSVIKFQKLDFRKAMGTLIKKVFPLHMVISGETKLEGKISKNLNVTGSLDFTVDDFAFKTGKPESKLPQKTLFNTPQIHLLSKYKINNEGFFFDQTTLQLPNTRLNASGNVTGKNGFNIDVDGNVDLTDFKKFGAFDIAGKGDLVWTIRGVLPKVELAFDMNVENAKYVNLDLGKVKGKIVYNDFNDTVYLENMRGLQGRTDFIANGFINVADAEDINIDVDLPRGTVQDMAAIFNKFISEAVPWYPKELTGALNGKIKISGKTDLNKMSALADLDLQNIDFKHEVFRKAKMKAGYVRGSYVAQNIEIRKKTGTAKGFIEYDSNNNLNFSLNSDSLTTTDFDTFSSLGIAYRAPIQISSQGKGPIGTLVSSTDVTIGQGTLKSLSIPESSMQLKTANARMNLKSNFLGGQFNGNLDYGWKSGAASNLDLIFNHFNLSPVLQAINPYLASDISLNGIADGKATLRFNTGYLSKLSGMVDLKDFQIQKKNVSLKMSHPLNFQISNGNYEFKNLKFVNDNASITVNGKSDLGKVDYSINGDLSLSLFEFLNAEMASFSGLANVNASIFGKAEDPSFLANIKSSNADLRMKSVEQPFENLKFSIEMNDSKAKFNEISSSFADGAIRGSGSTSLYLYKVPDLDFKFDIDNSKVKVYPVVFARTNGKIQLKGTQLPYVVKADLSIAEAMIKESFNISEGSRLLKSSKFLPNKNMSSDGEYHLFELDMNLKADKNIFIKNDLFDAELKGDLKVINSIQTPRLLGSVNVLHGKILFKNNFFAVQSGNIRFNNPIALDPEFDLTAQTEMKGYKVTMVASGSVSDYKLTFQSQPSLSQNDIVNLLTLGVTSSDYQNISRENRDAYSRDEMYGLIFSQSGVNRSLKEKFGLNIRVDQSQTAIPENVFRARSSDQAGTVAPKVVLQKEVTKNLSATLGTTVGVGEASERNLELEYGVNKNMSVIGVYEDQNGPQLRQSRTSVGADLKFKLRFK